MVLIRLYHPKTLVKRRALPGRRKPWSLYSFSDRREASLFAGAGRRSPIVFALEISVWAFNLCLKLLDMAKRGSWVMKRIFEKHRSPSPQQSGMRPRVRHCAGFEVVAQALGR